jgi:mannose/cellobiose epimerase-like protein (N-acyl-D-glucosamine 2-epimerase family)/glycosyltransferase involved in cell wall biosynthesis
MISKSGNRFSEEIMLHKKTERDGDSKKSHPALDDVINEAAALRHWLMDIALPLWWEKGADHMRGGFYEAIELTGEPLALPHRARSIARQAFSFCEAGRLGWNGPWREAAQHAFDYLSTRFITSEGLAVSVVDLDGRVSDPTIDLYNQAFTLLAYAAAYRAFRTAEWRDRAVTLREALYRHHKHPLGGFLEGAAEALQTANPHMHLFEAALAWSKVDDDHAWVSMADDIAQLCLGKLIDAATGALRECFSNNWSPAAGVAGGLCEPGHHYEWAFLLDAWAAHAHREKPSAVSGLIAFADRYGIDRGRGVAINATLSDGQTHDPVARLWAQAERIRAYLVAHRPHTDVVAAIQGFRSFLATPVPGLWFDQLRPDGTFVNEPARATSLYHIIGAVAALCARFPAVEKAPTAVSKKSPRRLVYLVTEDWYFISHRLPMARAARDAGFEVHVATRVNRHAAQIIAEGFRLHPIAWRRGSLNPHDLLRVVREVRDLYRRLTPDIAHHVALPAAVVGSLAATGLPVVCLNAMTGLGTIFISDASLHRLVRGILRPALRSLFSRQRAAVLVQNRDDEALVEALGIDRKQITLIPGSGVDITEMAPAPEPPPPIAIAFVGRLVESKGIHTLVAAHAALAERGRDIRLLIAGNPDAANPTSISEEEIEGWKTKRNLSYLGFVEDIAALWRRAHIAVLPSHREGLPLSLIQAAACGRPLIATDVPGCRAIARRDVNALLVPRDDVEALAQAIDHLAADEALRRRFGTAGRRLVEQEFSSERIGAQIVALYQRLLACSS